MRSPAILALVCCLGCGSEAELEETFRQATQAVNDSIESTKQQAEAAVPDDYDWRLPDGGIVEEEPSFNPADIVDSDGTGAFGRTEARLDHLKNKIGTIPSPGRPPAATAVE